MEILIKAWEIFNNMVLPITVVLSILSGLSVGLEKIKDMTETNLDNKIFDILNKIASIGKKVLDFITANRPH